MPAPKGHKPYGRGPKDPPILNDGRPRKHDREKIAKDMIEWAKQPDSVNLNKFCALHAGIAPSKLWEFSQNDENFRESFERAKSFLAFRREEMLTNNQLHVKAYDNNAAAYDFFIRQERREQAAFEAKLKQEEPSKVPEDDQKRHDRLIETLTLLQSESKSQVEDKISNS